MLLVVPPLPCKIRFQAQSKVACGPTGTETVTVEEDTKAFTEELPLCSCTQAESRSSSWHRNRAATPTQANP